MNSSNSQKIKLNDIHNEIPKLSSNILKSFAEAGAYCFYSQGHLINTKLEIIGDYKEEILISWDEVTEKVRNTYADLQEAVEWGATAVSFVLIKRFTNYSIVERSYKGTGFDYWLGTDSNSLFQDKARLEISGILKESPTNSIERRVKIKLDQINLTNQNLPGVVVVVEFSKPLSDMRVV